MSSFAWSERRADSGWRIAIEDDGTVAYAYLLRDDRIVSDVWLYNVSRDAPPASIWREPPRTPFPNAEGFVRRLRCPPLRFASDVHIVWTVVEAERAEAEIWLRGRLHAGISSETKPGWCRLAAKDGPLARVPSPGDAQRCALKPSGRGAFCVEVAAAHPKLGASFDAHVKDYDELLPHVWFGDVCRLVKEWMRASSSGVQVDEESTRVVDVLLAQIESGVEAAMPDVLDLVRASFLENLEGEVGYAALVARMGPHLLGEAKRRW